MEWSDIGSLTGCITGLIGAWTGIWSLIQVYKIKTRDLRLKRNEIINDIDVKLNKLESAFNRYSFISEDVSNMLDSIKNLKDNFLNWRNGKNLSSNIEKDIHALDWLNKAIDSHKEDLLNELEKYFQQHILRSQ